MLEQLSTIITAIFFLILLSYYTLLFLRVQKPDYRKKFSSITIIIPAHNEERYLKECITSVIAAKFSGKKEIIVVDDASKDATAKIARSFKQVILLQNKKHSGKSFSLNKALKKSTGDLVAVVDGDSVIDKNALVELAKEVARDNVGGAAAVVKVKNRTSFINPWVHLELIYGSFLSSILSKINANVVTRGALSMYRHDALLAIRGFSTQGFSEDVDVGIRLVRKGYHIGFSDTAITSTHMPDTPKGFLRQRIRFARGQVNLLKRQLRFNSTIIDLYTLPLLLFSYIQAIIMGTITLYKIISGYMLYFVDKGIYFNLQVVKFFFEWLSIIGFLRWTVQIFSGAEPLTIGSAIGIAATLLTYPLLISAIFKYDTLDLLHILIICFMFPFWLLLMIIYTLCLPEIFMQKQYNKWKKNE
jgi:cellulose synthase/poly-beta-1,6-N-acetylglucosamine synthase-like glycosyltransferase